MAQTPEGKVKDKVKKALREAGLYLFSDYVKLAPKDDIQGFFYMPVAGPFSVHGVHDFVGCWRGVFFSIETKAPDASEDCTPLQGEFMKATLASGGISIVGARDAACVPLIKELVQEILDGRKKF